MKRYPFYLTRGDSVKELRLYQRKHQQPEGAAAQTSRPAEENLFWRSHSFSTASLGRASERTSTGKLSFTLWFVSISS